MSWSQHRHQSECVQNKFVTGQLATSQPNQHTVWFGQAMWSGQVMDRGYLGDVGKYTQNPWGAQRLVPYGALGM